MKLGVSMWSYVATYKRGEMDIPKFIHTAKSIGADGVELLDFFWKDRAAEIESVDSALAETGLPVGVYSIGNDLVSTDPAKRAEQVAAIKEGVDNAVHFGAKVVRVFSGNTKEGISFEQAFDWIVEGLRDGAQYAESKDVKLALENHGMLAGKSGQVIKIIESVGSPALGANPDTGNFLLVHEAPHEALQVVAKVANMVHFKDFKEAPADHQGWAYTSTDGLKYIGTAIGEGDVALEACVQELAAAGFNGWLNIEYEGTEDPITAMPRSVAYTRSLLAKL